MKLVSFIVLAASLFSESVSAAPKALEDICKSAGMRPHTAVRTGLGAGSAYLSTGGSFTPSTQSLLCRNVFAGRHDLDENAVSDTVFFGHATGSGSLNASLSLNLLQSIIGPKNKADISAGLQRGDTWSATTGPLEIYGVDALGMMKFAAYDNDCFHNIRKVLQGKSSVTVLVIPQAVRTREIKYDVTRSNGGNASLTATLGTIVSVAPGFKVSKSSSNSIDVKSADGVNLCWAAPRKFKMRRDTSIGPRNFRLDPI